jgi:hypothetical protein
LILIVIINIIAGRQAAQVTAALDFQKTSLFRVHPPAAVDERPEVAILERHRADDRASVLARPPAWSRVFQEVRR